MSSSGASSYARSKWLCTQSRSLRLTVAPHVRRGGVPNGSLKLPAQSQHTADVYSRLNERLAVAAPSEPHGHSVVAGTHATAGPRTWLPALSGTE